MDNVISINAKKEKDNKQKEEKLRDLKASLEILKNTSNLLNTNNLDDLNFIKKQIKLTISILNKEIKKYEKTSITK